MGIFGKSFNQKVGDALAAIGKMGLGIRDLRAKAEGKVVTLEGQADNLEIKGRVMAEFNRMVKTENTINKIQVLEPRAAQPGSAQAPLPGPIPAPPRIGEETIYEVQKGDTLSALAQRFYGKASLYPKIFEANRDILSNPDLIKIGQKLRIPK
jgi:LysM repeat protein